MTAKSSDRIDAHHAVEVDGSVRSGFGAVKDAFAANFVENDDVGASVAVAIDGDLVVDLWAGHLERERVTPWSRDTIINTWSTTKTMCNLCALTLAARGLLDIDSPIARYWPEFAAAGKQNVLVRHALAHTSGVAGWDQPLVVTDLADWDRVTSLLANQAPWWEPGSRSGYHGLTQGNIVGEIVRRIDGRSIGTFFAEEIADPLGADFYIGLPAEHDGRVARVIPGRPLQYVDNNGKPVSTCSIPGRAMNPELKADDSWNAWWRRAEIPAAGGTGNARSVAKVQSVVSAGGSAHGLDLLAPATVDRIFDVQAAGRDLVLGYGVTMGVGYALNSPRRPMAPSRRVSYWGGWGGSLVVNDLDQHMTMAYVMNRMGDGTTGDERAQTILRAVYDSLGL